MKAIVLQKQTRLKITNSCIVKRIYIYCTLALTQSTFCALSV